MATRTISNTGGNWNATATWVEGVVPVSADDVYATPTSGPLTVNLTGNARSLDLSGYANTLTMSAGINLGTSTARPDLVMLRLSPTMTQVGSGQTVTCGGSYAADFVTIDTAGVVLTAIRLTFSGVTAKWKLASSFTSNQSNAINHQSGYLDFNNQNVNINQMTSNGASVRTLVLGTGSVAIAALTFGGSNLTFPGAPNITISNWLSNTYPGLVFGDLTFTVAGTRVAGGTFTCRNLTRVGTTAANDALWFGPGDTVTITGTLTVTDNSGTGLWMGPGGLGSSSPVTGNGATIALGATGIAALSGVDMTDLTFTGVNTPVTGTRFGDALGNSGAAFDAARTLYWVGGAGNWSDSAHWSFTSGGAGGQLCPKPQDDVVFDNASFSGNAQTAATNYGRLGRDVTFNVTNRTGCNFGANGIFHIFGSYTFGSTSAGLPSNTSLTFRGRGSHTIRAPNATIIVSGAPTIDAGPGTYTLGSDMQLASSFSALTLLSGTLRLSTYTLKVGGGLIGDSGTLPRTFDMGTGVYFPQQGNTAFGTTASGFTLAGTGTIQSTTGASTYTLKTSGQTVPKVVVQAPVSGTFQLADNLAAGTIIHTGGTFDLNGKVVVCTSLTSSGSTGRTLLMGAANLTVNGFLRLSGTNLTVTPGTSTVTVVGGPFSVNGATLNAVTLRPPASATDRLTVETPTSTVATLTIDGIAAQHGVVVFQDGMTVTGTLTATGQSAGNPIVVHGPDFGGQTSISATTTTLSAATFNRITPSGTGSWTGTNVVVGDNGWHQAIAVT